MEKNNFDRQFFQGGDTINAEPIHHWLHYLPTNEGRQDSSDLEMRQKQQIRMLNYYNNTVMCYPPNIDIEIIELCKQARIKN